MCEIEWVATKPTLGRAFDFAARGYRTTLLYLFRHWIKIKGVFTRENSHRREFHIGMTFWFRIAFTWWLGHFIALLWRAKRACGAPWVSKSTHPRKFGNHVTVHRPPVRPHYRATSFQSPHFLTYIAHQCCDQLTAVKTGYPLTSITWPYRGPRCRPIEVDIFLKLSADKLPVFKWPQAQV